MDRTLALITLLAALALAGCGDEEDGPASTTESGTSDVAEAALDPAAVEASVAEQLADDEYAGSRSPEVDCGEEPAADELQCTLTGEQGLTGEVVANPQQGFQYTGQLEGPDGPSGLGGSSSEGELSDVAAVTARLDEALADRAGASAECPDAPTDDELECTVSGGDYTGTITVTPIGGFEFQAQFETPEGTRVVAGNDAG